MCQGSTYNYIICKNFELLLYLVCAVYCGDIEIVCWLNVIA